MPIASAPWFDFEWYVRKGTPLNLQHFLERARQSGDIEADTMKPAQFNDLLLERGGALHAVEINRTGLINPQVPAPSPWGCRCVN